MKITLFKYIFKMQLKVMLFISLFMFCLILLFDFAEVARKFPISTIEQVLFSTKLSLLRTPSTFCEILHYIYFIAATFSMWHLCSSNQMTILKSVGHSPQQILCPFIMFAFCVSAIWLFILHPCGNFTEDIYNKLAKSQAREANENIWMNCARNKRLVFIKQIVKNEIDGFCIFDFHKNKRIFAKQATLKKGKWNLRNVTIFDCNLNTIRSIDNLIVPSGVSNESMRLLKKPPRKHDVYSLRNVYFMKDNNQAELQPYKFELHKLLANCMHFILFALIAATICFPINRYKTRTGIIAQVIAIAMTLRFANNIAHSIACAGTIGVVLKAWAVVIAAIFIAIGILIWKEM